MTLYRVGAVKQSGESRWVAIDGGISDNPRPQLYDARYTAVVATRVARVALGTFAIAGKHCESGDVLIDGVELAGRRAAAICSPSRRPVRTRSRWHRTYNAVPRPAAVLVAGGDARVIRRRETVDDLLAVESP